MKRKTRRIRKSLESAPLSSRFLPPPEKRLDYIPGKMIVKIKGSSLRAAAGTLRAGGSGLAARVLQDLPESVTGPLDYLSANAGLKYASAVFVDDGQHKLKGIGASTVAALSSVADSPHEDLQGFTVVSVDPKKVTGKLLRHLSQSNAIQFAEPMPARWIAKKSAAGSVDPLQKQQWSLEAMGWFDAPLPTSAQSQRVKVGVLDTGIDMTHPEFRGVVESYDHSGVSATDIIGHGTHVAGIIGALTHNGVGISGLSSCRLAVWKIFGDEPIDGEFYVDGELYLRALGQVADAGCSVINLSIGGYQQSRAEALLFQRLRARNVLPIAAMGNEFEEGNPTEFPAAYTGVVAVGAISSELRRASFSNTGRHIWVVAPGHTIISTVPKLPSSERAETEYATWSGTSMATPHVVGAAALYRAKKGATATADAIETALKSKAKRLVQMGSRPFTIELGYGLVYLPDLL